MRDFVECKPFLDYLAAEHRQLRHALQDIDAWLRNPAEVRDSAMIGERMRDLRAQLMRHFAEEEDEGCLEEAVCRCPSLSPQVAELQREHPELLQAVDNMLGLLGAQTPCALNLLVETFTQLMHRLETHEYAESRILQQAFGSDQGIEDA